MDAPLEAPVFVRSLSSADATSARKLLGRPPSFEPFRAAKLLLASLAVALVTFGVLVVGGSFLGQMSSKVVGGVGFGTAAFLAMAGAFSAIVSIATRLPRLRARQLFLLVSLLLSNGFMALFGAMLTLLSVADFRRGRQLRQQGRVLLPPLARGDAWSGHQETLVLPDELRSVLAKQWRENGRTEHASVAAFARLTLDLIALGAPPNLVRDAQRDALDEIRHAQLCFALARSIDGAELSPGPFAAADTVGPRAKSRSLSLASLAVDSLVDGALHEGVSARVIAQLAKRAAVPQIRELLRELAADEGRHAAHGWEVVEWCVQQGGRPVIEALAGAVSALPASMTSPLPAPARDGNWERYGIHGYVLEAAEYEKARRNLTQRIKSLEGRRM